MKTKKDQMRKKKKMKKKRRKKEDDVNYNDDDNDNDNDNDNDAFRSFQISNVAYPSDSPKRRAKMRNKMSKV